TRTTVTVSLRHPFPSDLTLTLTSPSGKEITLLRTRYLAVSPTGVITLTFDDAAGSLSVPDAQGRIRPEEPLAAFLGDDANGPWTLTVTDTVPRDSGSLVGWSLTIAGEPVTVSNPDGSFALPRNGAQTKPVRFVPNPGFVPV